MDTLITAGCGISYKNFEHWPTWPKYCQLSHSCNHINVGGPASGNEHIGRSVVRAVAEYNPNCVVVVWTNVDKLDIFVDNNELAQRIKNYPTRNFLVDWQTNIVEPPANWPSSTSNDNDIKQWYKNNIESKTYYYIRTLESILSVQHICQLRGISCYMFWGYPIDHEFAKTDKNVSYLYDLVDWDSFVTQQAMEEHYSQGPWFEYCTTKQHGLVPVAGWHWEFYQSHIQPIMDRHYTAHNQNKFLQLKNFVETITKEKFNQGSS